ncbi:hypothetical protein [Streptomyces rimosus]|uniref:hypothetical protein n=1 Tax=Streptomyces rimosus TaxID=1927 RepID=UPI0037CD5373
MTGWSWAWIAWLAAFAAIEGKALTNKEPGDTLSEHVRRWFATTRGTEATAWVRVRRAGLLGFMAWLTVHFLVDGFM